MNVASVMDEVIAELDANITELRCFTYPPDNVPVPCAFIDYPEAITYDVTMGRGVDQIDFPLFVLVGRLTDRTSRDKIAPYLSGSGSSSVKATILAGKPWTAMASVRVASATVEVVTMAGVDYLAAVFVVNVFGTGD